MNNTPSVQPYVEANIKERARLTIGDVLAVWLQNLGGGIGAAIAAALVARVLHLPGSTIAEAALYVGGSVFALLMVFRAVIDEIMDGDAYLSMQADNAALEAERDDAVADAQGLRVRVRELEVEAAAAGLKAKRDNFVAPAAAPDDPIGKDARAMVETYFDPNVPAAERSASREVMAARGWSRSRYEDAYAELIAAGVIVPKGKRPAWCADAETAYSLLAARAQARLAAVAD